MTRTRAAALILPLLLTCLDLVDATKFSVNGISKRASMTGIGQESLTNTGDLEYFTNITLSGKPFTVQIDTGSSDLYVGKSVPNSQNTGKTAKVTYVIGSAQGSVFTADLDFLGYQVPNQAFILDTSKDDGTGLVGLGPNYGSQIYASLNNAQGNSVLDRIFLQNTSTPNYLTVMLGRADDPDAQDQLPGDITVGEVVTGYENITSQPQLPVTILAKGESTLNQHWQIALDQDGITGPDGMVLNTTSVVNGSKNLTAVLDTGFSLPQVPRSISDSIYSRIEGSAFKSIDGLGAVWTVPCTAEVNITFKIGGIKIPIHPLDAVDQYNDGNGGSICYGAFQPRVDNSDTYDIILGMAWLRNAYILINFGDFVQGQTNKVADPYVQLLPLTDISEAHADFVTVRLNGFDTTGGQTLLNNVTPSGPPDPVDTSSQDNKFTTWAKKNKWILIGVGIGVGVLLIIAIVACVIRSNRRKTRYRPLHEPAPYGDSHYTHKR